MENTYETLQNIYIRPYLHGVIQQTTDTTATIKNEIIYPVASYVILPVEEPETEAEVICEESDEKKKTICNICGGKYSYFNKKRHELTQKHLSALPSALPSSPLLPAPVVIPDHEQ